jgi:hypothetical protein
MKLSTICKNLAPGRSLLLATSAFAENNVNKGSFDVFEPLTVSGHQLAPGQYKLTWDGTGSRVELMILSQGKLVATVPARLIELGQAGRENATESQKNDDGSQSLTQIDFAGKKYALAFGVESAATDSRQPVRTLGSCNRPWSSCIGATTAFVAPGVSADSPVA